MILDVVLILSPFVLTAIVVWYIKRWEKKYIDGIKDPETLYWAQLRFTRFCAHP
jgi:hypothetical protein